MMLLDGILCIAAGLILGTGIGWVAGWRSYNDKMSEILEDYIREKERKDKGGEKKMIDKERLREIMNEMDEVINQAYDLDEELDISSFLERISDINNEIEELIDGDDD